MRSRFSHLEDLEEQGCSNMETGDEMKDVTNVGDKAARMESGSSNRKSKPNMDAVNVDGSVDGFVLRASHPSLVEGSKRVGTTDERVNVNPDGQSILRRMKERVLKEVTNKLDVGPVTFKPLWAGSRLGRGTFTCESDVLNNKGLDAKACLGGEGLVRTNGSDSRVGSCPTLIGQVK